MHAPKLIEGLGGASTGAVTPEPLPYHAATKPVLTNATDARLGLSTAETAGAAADYRFAALGSCCNGWAPWPVSTGTYGVAGYDVAGVE